jgi:formylglycine-generating enzyme required for sulfatase activity
MRNFVIWCVVLLGIAGTAFCETKGPPKKLAVDLGKGVKLEMVLIPAGEFKMGSPQDEKNRLDDEGPQHRVRIAKPFYMGIHEVTIGQFRQFVADTGYKTDAEKGRNPGAWGWNPDKKEFDFKEKYSWRNAGFEQTDEHPVVNVSWNDAVAFCEWLSKKEGKSYRLPTEAQWEYACRAGTTTRYSSGDDPETLAKVGNVADATAKTKFPDWSWTIAASDGYVFTAPVGKFKPNVFGLYDMHGNVWEWCADWYGNAYYAASPADDPKGPASGSVRVRRGGGWGSYAGYCRSAGRNDGTPGGRHSNLGFRVSLVSAEQQVM